MSAFEKLRKNGINISEKDIKIIAAKYSIKEISVFGSSIRDEFDTDSDIDLLIEFYNSETISLYDIIDIQEYFEKITQRPVDIVEPEGLLNPYRRENILNKSYIYDMLTYSNEIIDIINDENHAAFLSNRVKRLAVERLIEIIGEAANHISEEVINKNDDIPWSKIIGLRNKIVHDYGEILTDRIWLIASKAIPELINLLNSKKFIWVS